MAIVRQIVSICFVALGLIGIAAGQTRGHWVGSWASSQQVVEPQNSLTADDLHDVTLRQVVHLSLGGSQLRIRLSNRFGSTPLQFAAVHVARPGSAGSGSIIAGSDLALTFSGSASFTVPAGADYTSDPVSFPAQPLSDVAITFHLDALPQRQTGHPGSRATSYLVHGNRVSATDLPDAKRIEHWYFIAGVDVDAPVDAGAIVTLGDSITDGHGATTDGNDRWPDLLAKRLHGNSATQGLAVLNRGIGGNRLLLDGLGPNAAARFDEDVLVQAGVRAVIVFEGVNDLGMMTREGDVSRAQHQDEVRRISGAYQQMIAKAHTHGIQAIGATITPFVGSAFYHPGARTEADRQRINDWIRTPGHFDAVVDFDAVLRDPARPDVLESQFDSGDHLHPSAAGYRALADAVPLSLFDGKSAPQIAITFDDLPAHGPLPPGETRMEVASKIIAAMREARLPPVYGFVNGVRVQENAADGEVLKAWRDAGNPLANHGWSHMNLNQHPLEEFEADLLRNEELLKALMPGEDWHWLRFPFLAEGDTPEKRAGVRAFLLQHGYRVAAVTMSFGDYRWNEPYARCEAKADAKAVELLKSSYMEAADQSIDYYRNLSQQLFGHDIPYVLLMHIGALDAEMLPKLVELYKSRGFEFITLKQAERDSFYTIDSDLGTPPGPDMLEWLAAERHLQVPQLKTSVQPEDLCK
jgi:lysophospholipase L1-like esterase